MTTQPIRSGAPRGVQLLSAVNTGKHGFGLWLEGEKAAVTTPASLGESNAQEFWEILAFACARGQLVAVDMSRTRTCDARALAALVMALRYTDTYGVELRLLLGPASPIRMTLAERHLDVLFPVFDSLRDALAEDPWWLPRLPSRSSAAPSQPEVSERRQRQWAAR